MLRSNSQGASPLAIAVASISLNVSPGKAQEGPVQELPTVEVTTTKEKPEGPGSSQAGAGLGGRFTGYTVDLESPAVAAKDNTPILQTPLNIQVAAPADRRSAGHHSPGCDRRRCQQTPGALPDPFVTRHA